MKIDLVFWLILVLSASTIVHFMAFYYIRVVLGKLLFVGDNLSDLTELVANYRKHLKSVYEMEMFYGDETLQHLIRHTKSLYDLLEDFEDIYAIAEPPEEETGEVDEIKEEETELNAKTKIDQENVFYGGTRTSDS